MNKVSCLHCLIKWISQQKGRKIKIICDWDDTIQAYDSSVFYEITKRFQGIEFENFFNNWSKEVDKIKEKNDLYDRIPFITPANELLLAIRENLVEELVFLSFFNKRRFPNGDKRKEEKFQKTFGKLSQAKTSIKMLSSSKSQWIAENHPDFDIFIDDLPKTICESVENFSLDKIFVMPDQELIFGSWFKRIEGKNVYHLSTSISSLKDRDFEETTLNEDKNINIINNNKNIQSDHLQVKIEFSPK